MQYIDLLVEYPSEYPEVAPEIDIEVGEKWVKEGTSEDEEEDYDDEDDESENEHALPEIAPALLELNANDTIGLKRVLQDEAENNLGMASIFTLASLLKEEAEALVQKKYEAAEADRVKELLRQEAEENKKFVGTPVTPESFKEWRAKFREEFHLDKKLDIHTIYDSKGQPKLTGQQLFERGLSKFDDDDDDTELESGVANLKV